MSYLVNGYGDNGIVWDNTYKIFLRHLKMTRVGYGSGKERSFLAASFATFSRPADCYFHSRKGSRWYEFSKCAAKASSGKKSNGDQESRDQSWGMKGCIFQVPMESPLSFEYRLNEDLTSIKGRNRAWVT